MTEKVISLNDKDVRLIRNSVEKLTIQSDLRRKLIGGISEEDVAKYVESVRQQSQLVEEQLHEKIQELQAYSNEIRREFESYKKKNLAEKANLQSELSKALSDSSAYMNNCNELDALNKELYGKYDSEVSRLVKENSQLESRCSGLAKKLAAFEQEIEQLKKSSRDNELSKHSLETRIEELDEQLRQSRKTADDYCEACKVLEQNLNNEKENAAKLLEGKTNSNTGAIGFKDGIDAIYRQLSSLNEQINLNEDLQKQLESEHVRAEKAERELSRFGELASGLKEKFQKGQKQLNAQFTDIEEKQKVINCNISGLRTNLEGYSTDIYEEIDNLCEVMENTTK